MVSWDGFYRWLRWDVSSGSDMGTMKKEEIRNGYGLWLEVAGCRDGCAIF
jgi:hypothetical protein